jgi:nucleoside-diphosphate-sugar epimerase
MKILMTGATGYLGKHLTKALLEKEHAITCILHRSQLEIKHPLLQGFTYHQDQTKEFIQKFSPDVFINCSGKYLKAGVSKNSLNQANYLFPREMIQHLNNSTHIINFSTALPRGLDEYSESKHLLEDFLEQMPPEKRCIINFKTQQFFGFQDGRIIQFLMEQFLAEKPLVQLTHGHQKRDFLYIKDLIEAVLLCIEKINIFEAGITHIPLGSGTSYSIREVWQMIHELYPKAMTQPDWGAIPLRKNEPEDLLADTTFLKKLGWAPKHSMRTALSEISSLFTQS